MYLLPLKEEVQIAILHQVKEVQLTIQLQVGVHIATVVQLQVGVTTVVLLIVEVILMVVQVEVLGVLTVVAHHIAVVHLVEVPAEVAGVPEEVQVLEEDKNKKGR
jgi:hypothetical protein